MTDSEVSRRAFVQRSLAATGASAMGALPVPHLAGLPPRARLTVVCVGAHPDDPESGCGGTLAAMPRRGTP